MECAVIVSRMSVGTAVLGLLGLSASAEAAVVLSLSSAAPTVTTCGSVLGTATTVVCGSSSGTPQNNVVGGGMKLSDKSVLSTTAANVTLSFYYIGSESGWTNRLRVESESGQFHNEDNSNQPVPNFNLTAAPTAKFAFTSYQQAAAGAVFMRFSDTAASPSYSPVYNSTNASTVGSSIAFAFLKSANCSSFAALRDCLSLDGSGSWVATNYVLFGLDDGGAGPNDNHDDWMGVVVASADESSVVPLPAAAWLMLSGLAGLGLVGRRRRNPTA